MVDVFISYGRQELERVRRYHDALRDLGLELFFDIEGGIDSGDTFPDVINGAVRGAKAVLGCWTPYALSREWVKIECQIGKDANKLVAAEVEPLAQPQVPAQFYLVSRESLADHDGPGHEGWARVLEALATRLDAWAQARPVDPAAPATLEKAAQLRVAALEEKRLAAERRAAPKPDLITPAPSAPAAPPHSGPTPEQIAARWARIESSLDPRVYTHFIDQFPNALEAFDAKLHRQYLEDWAAVDQTSLQAIARFAAHPSFPALPEKVAAAEAELAAEQARRQEAARRRTSRAGGSSAPRNVQRQPRRNPVPPLAEAEQRSSSPPGPSNGLAARTGATDAGKARKSRSPSPSPSAIRPAGV